MIRICIIAIMGILLAVSACGYEYLKVQDVTMYLENDDALLQVNYTLDSFARLYVLALGCSHIKPDLDNLFISYGELKTIRADPYRAVLLAEGVGNYTNGYYLFDSKPLGSQIARFKVKYPGGLSRVFSNVTSTPSVFIEAKDRASQTKNVVDSRR